jgi:nanoRNase/pAp phosphatase (c-di-AMP/oligoRNAs hydrolase)
MRHILVCPDDFLWQLVPRAALTRDAPVYVVASAAARATIVRHGGQAVAGNLERDAVYRRAFRSGDEPVLVAVPPDRRSAVIAAIRATAPAAPIVILADDRSGAGELLGVPTVTPAAFSDAVIEPALQRAITRAGVDRIRRHFSAADRILIMMQDDPDPDAIASALALKTLLGRAKPAATLGTFGTITRPENRALTRILEIDVEQIKPRAIGDYDMVAMVDTQPSFFEEAFGEVDLVIDHHPEETPIRARLRDVRPAYGATSTILTEYLRAANVKLTQRLATALLYGITADTQHLERGATRADLDAFAFVHGLANHSALRRIERPEVPVEALDALAVGLRRRQLIDGVMFVHLGPVRYQELVAQFADLLLQVEGAEWSVVSGTLHGELHVSVRNVGYVRAAGDVVRQAFGDIAGAGGHRAMAKAVVRLRDWRTHVGDTTDDALAAAIVTRFLRALRGGDGPRARDG